MGSNRKKFENALQQMIDELQEAANEAGERIAEFLERASVRERLSAAAKSVEALRLELARNLRAASGTKPAPPPARPPAAVAPPAQPPGRSYKEMTVTELRRIASERAIPGRSSMTKAELVAALGKE